jgi:hypothetical protein
METLLQVLMGIVVLQAASEYMFHLGELRDDSCEMTGIFCPGKAFRESDTCWKNRQCSVLMMLLPGEGERRETIPTVTMKIS